MRTASPTEPTDVRIAAIRLAGVGVRHIDCRLDTRQVADPQQDEETDEHADDGRRREGTGRSTAYADDERLHAALTHLRANNPVAWVDNPPYRPFWAITKHADIMAIERDNNLFVSEPRPLLATAPADDLAKQQLEAGMGLRTLIHMDDPHHRKVRAIGADWFRPRPCAS